MKDLNECILEPHLCNSGICTNTVGSYHCTCPLGYYGKQCDIAETCDSHPCKNGATCTPGSSHSISCKCVPGYSGTRCEISPHLKSTKSQTTSTTKHITTKQCPKNCNRHGRCTQGKCYCSDAWTGIDCSITNHCNTNPCKNQEDVSMTQKIYVQLHH
ncbi:unnamed protein product [Mytilus edulis]|uniref:EGF-like domain-containing protein n=1 Tax=Mytilus edulis TaxID=6550 RepID=A0A8S3TA17_MYTED|nr:unnamed protein product [Mytilus edulis]